ncbi:MAG: type II secretion system minor pseudopilin GspH [Gammaproteobacteria bacterium]|nr:type II secretion system minor pseudopilin GspH [Gammaproteobacteria bacterium]
MPQSLRPLHVNVLKPNSGFTLIELLVVIVLISIIVSMATLAITSGTPKERLKKEAGRFAALLQLAQDDSLLNGTEFGIRLADNSYQFVTLTEQGWQAVTNNNSLRLRQLPADMLLELELDFQPASLESSVSKIGEVSKVGNVEKFEDDKEKKHEPQIYLLSSGEIAPSFMLNFLITDTDASFSVQGTEDGSLKIQYHSL